MINFTVERPCTAADAKAALALHRPAICRRKSGSQHCKRVCLQQLSSCRSSLVACMLLQKLCQQRILPCTARRLGFVVVTA